MAKSQKRRGPLRDPKSTVKIACAYKHCRCPRDVKNVSSSLRLTKTEAKASQCRAVRSHCAELRFCCEAHLRICKAEAKSTQQGQREVLDESQLPHFFQACLRAGYPWLAVLTLLQTMLGERADCARQIQVSWFADLDYSLGKPAQIRIQKVNRKTVRRTTPLAKDFAHALFNWMHHEPLRGAGNTTWPYQGQDLSLDEMYLFPGMLTRGRNHGQRNWRRPVSERGYLKAISVVAMLLEKERGLSSGGHVMEGVDLRKLGTHTFKASGITLMREHGHAPKVVSAIAATSTETIDRYYERPTAKRQRRCVEDSFAHVFSHPTGTSVAITDSKPALSASAAVDGRVLPPRRAKFCSECGKRRLCEEHVYCPFCRNTYDT